MRLSRASQYCFSYLAGTAHQTIAGTAAESHALLSSSGSKSMPKKQDEEKIENPPQDLPLFLPFLPPLGAASLSCCGATVKKGVS